MKFAKYLAAVAMLAAASAAAEQYPAKPVKILVAFTAGGTSDIMARMLAQRLTERQRSPLLVGHAGCLFWRAPLQRSVCF